MRRYFMIFLAIILSFSTTFAGDLYKVDVKSKLDADILNSMDAIPVLNIKQGYIVLLPEQYSEEIAETRLNFELLRTNISRDQLYIQSQHGKPISKNQNVLYQDGDIYLIQDSKDFLTLSENIKNHIFQVPDRTGKVRYTPLSASNSLKSTIVDGLDTIIAKISQDSLESYLHRLEAFNGRLSGTDSCYASRDWIQNKFQEFGYTQVVLDQFIGGYSPVACFNVIATKVGSRYPDQHIIIGGHYDGVPGSPASDDNGTGTAAVLEMARVLKDLETEKTLIFIAFDSEESGLIGAYHYADLAFSRGDNIVVMLNADMIGNIGNSNEANLFTGVEQGYAHLWSELSDSLVNISGILGNSGRSDHYPFQVNGYDVVFVHERLFSSVYHSYRDSTSYIDFDYFTRMTKGTLATAFTVDKIISPVTNLQLSEPGDGNSLLLSWDLLSHPDISHYYVYSHKSSDPVNIDSTLVSILESELLIENLDEGTEYSFYVKAFDINGNTSIVYDIITGAPNSIPVAPQNLFALPKVNYIQLSWSKNNVELDFDHYNLYRDSVFIHEVADTFYNDISPSLGSELHEYFVVAVDSDGIESAVSNSVISRIAVLEHNRILALNRSTFESERLVDEVATGQFMREALDGYNYDYYSDTAYIKLNSEKEHFNLFDMLDYGIVVIGAESADIDDIALSDLHANLSEILLYYLSSGGKLLIFGRWGDISQSTSTKFYNQSSPTFLQLYSDCFNLSSRVSHETSVTINSPNIILSSELIGAKSQISGYPNLEWDSTLTSQHSIPYQSPNGVPVATYVTFNSSDVEVLYTFDSDKLGSQFEDKPVAWKNVIGPNKYVYFDIPLSLFNRAQAIDALHSALNELLDIPTDINDQTDLSALPKRIQLNQNYPNPFNPSTTIEFSLHTKEHVSLIVYNIMGQKVNTIADKVYPAGSHKVEWDGTNSDGEKVSSGIYLYKLVSEDFSVSKKMVLLK